MKVEIKTDGTLVLLPETSSEAYAVEKWLKDNDITKLPIYSHFVSDFVGPNNIQLVDWDTTN